MKRWLSLLMACVMALLSTALASEAADLSRMLEQGAAFAEQADYESAAMCYEIAVKLANDNLEALKGYANALCHLEKHQEALSYLDQALEVAPSDAELYLSRCTTRLALGDCERAAKDLRYAELCGPVSPENYAQVGMAFEAASDYESAVAAFEKAGDLALDTAFAEAYGRALVRTGNREQATALNLIQPKVKDARLSDALERGAVLRLEDASPDLANCPFFCSTAYWTAYESEALAEGLQGTPSADGKRVKMADKLSQIPESPETIQPLAASLDGSIWLYSMDSLPVVYRNGELTAVTANPARGAADQGNEQLDKISYSLDTMLERGGIAWSPDGRYAALTFPRQFLTYAKIYDLILIDLENGDMFLAESTPADKSLINGGFAPLYARFDESGKFLYYIIYGDLGEDTRAALRRYDVETGLAETVCASPVLLAWPGLYPDIEGQLRCLIDTLRINEHSGILSFSQNGDAWQATPEYFSAPGEFQYARNMQYSMDSGFTLLDCTDRQTGSLSYISILNDSDMAAASSTAVMIPKNHSGRAERVQINEDFLNRAGVSQDRENSAIPSSPWKQVVRSSLSPDGYFALLLTVSDSVPALELMDLETLTLAEVSLPESVQLHTQNINSASLSSSALEWIDGNQVLLSTAEGNTVFQLVWE